MCLKYKHSTFAIIRHENLLGILFTLPFSSGVFMVKFHITNLIPLGNYYISTLCTTLPKTNSKAVMNLYLLGYTHHTFDIICRPPLHQRRDNDI